MKFRHRLALLKLRFAKGCVSWVLRSLRNSNSPRAGDGQKNAVHVTALDARSAILLVSSRARAMGRPMTFRAWIRYRLRQGCHLIHLWLRLLLLPLVIRFGLALFGVLLKRRFARFSKSPGQ